MLSKKKLFKSKIAQRVWIMFISCALIPIILLVVLSYFKISNYLVEQNKHYLKHEAKAYERYLYSRIIQIDSTMRFVAMEIERNRDKGGEKIYHSKILENDSHFNTLTWYPDGEQPIYIVGQTDHIPILNEAERKHVKTGKGVLRILTDQNLPPRIFLMRSVNAINFSGGLLVGEIDLEKFWGLRYEEILPSEVRLLVFDHNKEFLIGNGSIPESYKIKLYSEITGSDSKLLVWEYDNQTFYTSVRPLFLRYQFLLPEITITLSQSKKSLLVSIDQFLKIFWLVSALTLLFVVFLCIKFIQKIFKPLEKLHDGTQRVMDGDFSHIVALESRDEFESLAESFNTMVRQLDTQFKHLGMLSDTGLIATQSISVEQVITSLISLIKKNLDFSRGMIMLRERDPSQIRVADAYGYQPSILEDWRKNKFSLDMNCKEYFVALSNLKTPLIMNEIKDIERYLSNNAVEHFKKIGVRSILYTPIIYNDQVLGSLILENPEANRKIGQSDLDLLIGITAHAGGSIFSAFTVEELRRKEKALKRSHQELEGRIHKRTAELYERNLELSEEILKRRRAEEEMRSAKMESDRANQVKSIFLANMSHELRTPLNHIIGFTELILDKHYGDLNETQFEYLSDVHHSSEHLLSLINDILDLAKVESGKQELRLADVNLKLLLKNSLVMVKEKALKHSIRMSLNVTDLPESINADERMLKQIIYNFLSNAVKFTPDRGEVIVMARSCVIDIEDPNENFNHETQGVHICVTDTGIGLKQEDLYQIFNPFSQAENLTTRRSQGTGLGLSLSKNLVELHGGKIWAESEGSGKGSAFHIMIPA